MKYPPTFAGFLKAVFDTFVLGKKLKPRIPKDEPARDIDDYEIYELDKDPDMEFWRTEAEKLVERKEQEKADAEKRMIEDYEFRHKDDRESEQSDNEANKEGDRINNESDSNDKATRKESAESEIAQKGTEDISSDQDAAKPEQDNSSVADDFHADVGVEIDEES